VLGGVPAYIDKLLGFGIDEMIEQRIKGINFTYQSRKKVALEGSKDIIYNRYNVYGDERKIRRFSWAKGKGEGGRDPHQ